MSNKATLQELYDVCINLVDEDNMTDFAKLANRAVKRLYSKAATSGDTVLYHMEVATAADHVDDGVDAVGSSSTFTMTGNSTNGDTLDVAFGVINYVYSSEQPLMTNLIWRDSDLYAPLTASEFVTSLKVFFDSILDVPPEVVTELPEGVVLYGLQEGDFNEPRTLKTTIIGDLSESLRIENSDIGEDLPPNFVVTTSSCVNGSFSDTYLSNRADAVPSSPHEHMPRYSVVLPAEYSHAKKFKISEGFDSDHATNFNYTPSGRSENIIPMESTFNNSGYDYDAFIDYGELNGVRVYGLPNWMSSQISEGNADFSVWGLLRKAYTPVSDPSDKLPFESSPAMKLAVLGTVYEDENDLERGNSYWAQAIQELESESQTYRGPQKMNVSFEDVAAYDVVETMN